MNKDSLRSFLTISFLVILTTWTPGNVDADLPSPDQAMLDRLLPRAKAVTDEALKQPMTYEHAILTIKHLVELRREALIEINGKTPLTSFDGIETQDRYDLRAIQSLLDITHTATKQDTTPPPREYHRHLGEAMGSFPALGDSPVAFMIYGLTDLVIRGLDRLWANPLLSREEAAKTAVVIIHAAALIFDVTTNDNLFQSNAAGLRQSSVVARLRCPVDQGTYAVSQMKNRVDAVGNIATLYTVSCQVCSEPIVLEFPQYLATRLNRMAEKQKIKKNRKSPRNARGVEP